MFAPEDIALGVALGVGAAYLLRGLLPAVAVPAAPRAAEVPEIAPIERGFEELIAYLDIGVAIVDRRGHLSSLNTAGAELFGVDPARALGRAFIEVVPSIVIDRALQQALRGEHSKTTAELLVPGVQRRLAILAHPLRDQGAVLVASDQTRVLALESIRRDFVSNVSHELRTPLSSIKLMVETVLASPGDESAYEIFLPKILAEVNRMVGLVQDLLEVARAESGQLQLRREQLDVCALANSVLAGFTQRAQMHGVTLHPVDAPAPLVVDADRPRLTQIFVNLIDNALRHTPRMGTIRLRAAREDGMALLSVIDSGDGIPFKDLPHIFERFYVVDRSRAREVGGTGLGLSIVRQIAEAHGGSVSVESDLGRGATFTCAIPLAAAVRVEGS